MQFLFSKVMTGYILHFNQFRNYIIEIKKKKQTISLNMREEKKFNNKIKNIIIIKIKMKVF